MSIDHVHDWTPWCHNVPLDPDGTVWVRRTCDLCGTQQIKREAELLLPGLTQGMEWTGHGRTDTRQAPE